MAMQDKNKNRPKNLRERNTASLYRSCPGRPKLLRPSGKLRLGQRAIGDRDATGQVLEEKLRAHKWEAGRRPTWNLQLE